MKALVASLAALGAVVLMVAPSAAADHPVAVGDNFFEPADITVAVGDTVVWTHSGTAPHSVTADDGSFDSHPQCSFQTFAACMMRGDTYSHTFDTAGDVPYYCRIHGGPGGQGMSAVVRVRAAPPTTTTAAPTTTALLPSTTASAAGGAPAASTPAPSAGRGGAPLAGTGGLAAVGAAGVGLVAAALLLRAVRRAG